MSEPFLAEIRLLPFNFAPKNWALCNGQLMAIAQNTALFSLLGTNFGGDGKVTFGLPNIVNRVVVGAGDGPGRTPRVVGEAAGSDTVTLTQQTTPAHTHNLRAHAQDPGELNAPTSNRSLARSAGGFAYGPVASMSPMAPQAVTFTGNGQPHENRQPFLTLNFCIALQGIFPSRP